MEKVHATKSFTIWMDERNNLFVKHKNDPLTKEHPPELTLMTPIPLDHISQKLVKELLTNVI